MKALIVKELRQTFVFPVVFVAALSAIWIPGFQFREVLLGLDTDTALAVAVAAAGFGALFGYLQFASERWLGTQAYLAHRGGGARAFFRAKATVGLASAWLVGFVPPLAFALVSAFGPNAAVIHWERLGDYALLSTAAVAPYCAAAWTAQLRRGKNELAILIWAAGCVPIMVALWSVFLSDRGVPFAAVWVALELGVGAALYALALRAFRDGRDRELPLGTTQHVAAIVLAGVFCLVVVSNAGTAFQEWASGKLLRSYPRVVQDGVTGEVFAAVSGEGAEMYRAGADGLADRARGVAGREAREISGRVVVTTSSDGTVKTTEEGPETTDDGTLFTLFTPYDTVRFERRFDLLDARTTPTDPRGRRWGWEFLGTEYFFGEGPRDRGIFECSRYFDRDAGVVRVITLADDGRGPRVGGDAVTLAMDPPFEVSVMRGDGRPFSAQTSCMGGYSGDACFVDPSDRTLWNVKIESGLPVVRPLALPNGDELLSPGETADRELAMSPHERAMSSSFALRGRQADYRWVDGKIVASRMWRQWNGSWSTAKPGAPRFAGWTGVDVQMTRPDPLALDVAVIDVETSKEKFSARFEPHTVEQNALGLALQLATVVKPPAGVVWSYFLLDARSSNVTTDGWWGRETLVAGGQRPLLALISALWGVFLTAVIVKRKRSYGYAPTVVVLSGLLTAIFGVWAFVWLALLDPRRCAARKVAGQAEPQPALVIQSA